MLNEARETGNAYLAVKVLPDGAFAVQDLLIDGVSITKAAREKEHCQFSESESKGHSFLFRWRDVSVQSATQN